MVFEFFSYSCELVSNAFGGFVLYINDQYESSFESEEAAREYMHQHFS